MIMSSEEEAKSFAETARIIQIFCAGGFVVGMVEALYPELGGLIIALCLMFGIMLYII